MRVLLVFFSLSIVLFAHKLNIFITQENNSIYINSYFASGQGCQHCEVEIFDEQNRLIKKGKTDIKGDFQLPLVKHSIEVQVNAGAGHMQMRSFTPKVDNNSITSSDVKQELILEKEKNSSSDMFKMLVGLVLIGLIFFILKRVKK